MQEIDFLPVQYRQKRVQRRSQPWRIVVVASFAVLLATAVLSQQTRKRQVEKELAVVMPQYDLAVGQNRKLAELQAQLTTARNAASLFTYLRHPWPRTQLLDALLAPLPEEITFEKLQITGEAPQSRLSPGRYARLSDEAEAGQVDKLPPAASDLKRLRDEFDATTVVVLISGVAWDSAALHRYLGELGRARLFSKTELDSLQSPQNDLAGGVVFRARLTVRPGYGQPGGPAGALKSAVAQTARRGE
jgi:hypothetical protein